MVQDLWCRIDELLQILDDMEMALECLEENVNDMEGPLSRSVVASYAL
jgi:hypothetical protein